MLCNNVKLLMRSDHSGWFSFICRSKTYQPCIGTLRLLLKEIPDGSVQINLCLEPENMKFSMSLLLFERSAFMLSFLFNKQLLFTAAKENAYYKHQGPFKIKKQSKQSSNQL